MNILENKSVQDYVNEIEQGNLFAGNVYGAYLFIQKINGIYKMNLCNPMNKSVTSYKIAPKDFKKNLNNMLSEFFGDMNTDLFSWECKGIDMTEDLTGFTDAILTIKSKNGNHNGNRMRKVEPAEEETIRSRFIQ